MKRAWPFLIASVVCAYLGVSPEPESLLTGPSPSLLNDGWHIASLVLAGIFVGVVIGSYKK